MTQEDLAEFSSLSVNFISKIKRTGNQNISIQKLDAIAKALQTSVITLIDESSKTPEPQAFASKLSNDRVFLDKLTNDMKKNFARYLLSVKVFLFYSLILIINCLLFNQLVIY